MIPFIEPIGNFLYPVDVSASYHSALHNVELNAWRPVGNWGQLLIGFRYLDLSENGLNLYNTVIVAPSNPSVSRIDANNHLSGFQVGFDSVPWSRNRLSLEGCVKAGIYDNHATNSVFITQDGPFVYTSSAKTDHAAFVGSLALTARYAITANLSARAGYQLLWIDGVALAPDQIAVSAPETGFGTDSIHSMMSTSGSPFYHGAFVGLEFQLLAGFDQGIGDWKAGFHTNPLSYFHLRSYKNTHANRREYLNGRL